MKLIKISILLFVILIGYISCTSKSDISKLNIIVRRAMVYEKEGKFNDAKLLVNKALQTDSNSSYLLTLRGRIYTSLDQYKLALYDFEKAIALNPRNISALYYKGWVFSKWESHDSAIYYYDKAVSKKTEGDVNIEYKYQEVHKYENLVDIPLYLIKFYRGISLYEKLRDDEALTDFKSALNSGYRKVDCQFYIGSILYNKGAKVKGCKFIYEAMIAGDKEAIDFYSKNCN